MRLRSLSIMIALAVKDTESAKLMVGFEGEIAMSVTVACPG